MLPSNVEADEQDTVCASSQDSCSTVSLFSENGDRSGTSEAEAGAEGRKDGRQGSVLPFASLLAACHGSAAAAVLPASFEATCGAGTFCDGELIVLRLCWRVQLPSAGAATAAGTCAGQSEVPLTTARGPTAAFPHLSVPHASDHLRHVAHDEAAGRARQVDGVHLPPVFVQYRVPGAEEGGVDGHGAAERVALSLPVGRSLFRQSLASCHEQLKGEGGGVMDSLLGGLVETSLSRHHADLTFFFKRAFHSSTGSLESARYDSSSSLSEKRSLFVLQSWDVTDLVSNTRVNGVPLSRHHRYHFRHDPTHISPGVSTRAAVGAFFWARAVTLEVGQYTTLEVDHMRPLPPRAAGLAGTPQRAFTEEDGEAVLVCSKSKSTSSKSPFEGHSLDAASRAAVQQQEGNERQVSGSRRQPRALPHSGDTLVSSCAAGTARAGATTAATEDRGVSSLQVSPPLSLVDSGSGAASRAALPLGKKQQQEKQGQPQPLPRAGHRIAAGAAVTQGQQAVVVVDSKSNSSSAGPNHCSGGRSPFATVTNDGDEDDSTLSSTPSSMRNSTWTETFVETLRDDGEERVSLQRPQKPRQTAPAPPPPPPPHDGKRRVLFTTGLRLTAEEERRLVKLGLVVNPDLRRAPEAEVLVVQRPLIRSVKLLTVLPYIDVVVQPQWLDEVLAKGDAGVATASYRYSERRSATSIEGANNFSLEETMGVPPTKRQTLFAPHTFWVHASAKPQEGRSNDLKSVITASGGKITKRGSQATVLVLAGKRISRAALRALAAETGVSVDGLLSSEKLLIYPDDLFRAVLQQKPLETSCVEVGTTQTATAAGASQRAAATRRSAAVSTVSLNAAVPVNAQRRRASTGSSSTRTAVRAASQKASARTGPPSGGKGASPTAQPSRKSVRRES